MEPQRRRWNLAAMGLGGSEALAVVWPCGSGRAMVGPHGATLQAAVGTRSGRTSWQLGAHRWWCLGSEGGVDCPGGASESVGGHRRQQWGSGGDGASAAAVLTQLRR